MCHIVLCHLTCHVTANKLGLMTTTPERSATLTDLVAAEIRAWLGRLDVRPSELARRMGENDQWLSTRLKGRTPINVNDLHRIAKALGLQVWQLMPAPDVAATAADPRTTHGYQTVTGQEPSRPGSIGQTGARPRDNRPAGHPATDGGPRTSRLPRGRRRPGN
jgi:transcriptional regulator with XRE-family HTH domain